MESFFSGVWRCRDDDDDGMDDRKKETEREEGFYARADIIKNFFSLNNNNYINEFVVLRYEYLKSISIVLHALYYIVCGES